MRFSASLAILCLTIIGSAFGLGGCGAARPPRSAPAEVVRPRIVGTVALVDEGKRFVLIDLESNLYVPSPGTALESRNAAGESAHLKAAPEQKRPFIAADILDGEPAVGDQMVR